MMNHGCNWLPASPGMLLHFRFRKQVAVVYIPAHGVLELFSEKRLQNANTGSRIFSGPVSLVLLCCSGGRHTLIPLQI
ncbi:hypothetical protein FHS90_001485 [Rufibacter quisquiliarum]|uniref:Uncharacterized protein n=1 Tax=Rufibacter quisquiliarum TaxID=1549639 RepID=A0A839GPG0_9BACT|nr:hypothetical protein [Rufibacter quisquiliarum]